MSKEEILARVALKAHLLSLIAVDYDGYRTVKGLMSLIDEIKEGLEEIVKMCYEHCSTDVVHHIMEESLSRKE